MYLSRLRLWNFRKYCSGADNKPGVEVHFHEGLNVLIGENDSGKTAIIDAIRYVLRTQSGEYIQFDDKDFYQDEQGNRKDEFKIECVFDGLNEQDSGLFWEWLSWNEDKTRYLLKVWLYVKRKDNVILPKFSAGIEGQSERMDSEARDLLKVVYFKPLRDALTDMTHGYKSRLAQILGAHELFKTRKDEQGNNKKHKLETDYEDLKREIENFFKEGGNGEIITEEINNFLHTHFLLNGDPRHAQIKLTGGELSEILRLLDLIMEGNKSGLGSLNLLCIAAEMLLFNNQQKGLELMEDSSLYRLRRNDLDTLYREDIHIANWGRKFAESEFLRTEERLIPLLFTTASERYELLLTQHPDLLQRMPLECLATYLGVTPVSLSRIRAKRK